MDANVCVKSPSYHTKPDYSWQQADRGDSKQVNVSESSYLFAVISSLW